jgi:spermidine synthase
MDKPAMETVAHDLKTLPESAAPVRGIGLPLALYAITGFTGLLAEQGFEKYIVLLVGATASASAVVLFTYFLGFAAGGVAAGWMIRRGSVRRPLRAYGLVELAVGVSCVAFSYSFHGLVSWMAPWQNVFGEAFRFHARFLSGCVLVLPTASLMGASFPLIARALDDRDASGRKQWRRAYLMNLAGALAASLAAPMLIMPYVGLRGALWICFALTAAVAGSALLMRERGDEDAGPSGHEPVRLGDYRLLLAASFASGAIYFALEVLWTHLIGITIGCSIYAFSWMLAAVLLGLLLGAALASRGDTRGKAIGLSALFQVAAVVLLVQFRLWDHVPAFFGITPPPAWQESFLFAETYKLYVAGFVLVPSSTVLGLIYPRLLASPQLEGAGKSYLAGYLSAANALGCLSGALIGIFVLLPRLGSELSLKLIVGALTAFGLLFVRHESFSRRRVATASTVGLMAVLLLATWRWDWSLMTAGTGNYFGRKPAAGDSSSNIRRLPAQMIFRHEGAEGGVTTVIQQTELEGAQSRTIRTMYTNGKFQGTDAVWSEGQAQYGFSAVPTQFVERRERALLIGLGTGHSAAALKNLGYAEVDIAEFAPGIVEAARRCFSGLNENRLNDPSVKLYLEDGRNLLLTHPGRQYDLITIEISSIWFAGATNLYSREFYEVARARLRPGGVLQQWVQLHHVGAREIASEVATIRSVFPHTSLWDYGNQGMVVAAEHPLVRSAAIPADMADRFQRALLLSPEAVDRLVAELHPIINTDHNRWIEYMTPRYQASTFDWMAQNRAYLAGFNRPSQSHSVN